MSSLRTSLLVSPLLTSLALAQAGPQPLSDAMAEAIAKEGIQNSGVHAILREMTGDIGHRLTGSENFTKACEWAKGHFEKMGLEVELEEWAEWTTIWSRGEWIGRIVEPIELDMYVATDAWTAGTDGLKTASFVEAPRSSTDESVGDTKGKWVLSRRKPTSRVRKAVEEAGALGVVYRANDPNQKYPTRVRVFGDSRVARMPVEQAPKLPEIAVRSDDFDRLWSLFEEGKQPVAQFDIQNEFRPGPIKLHNVIATLRGTEKPDEWVVVSSHLDSWHQAQGCTDNGTGSATTMEAARILTSVGAAPKRSIKFCLWGGEEQGLLGSRGYVVQNRTRMHKVSAVFNHDSGTNWAHALTIAKSHEPDFGPIVAPILAAMKPPEADHEGDVFKLRAVETMKPAGGGSDHASFAAVGVPAFSWSLKGPVPYGRGWHSQWDTYSIVRPDFQRHNATVFAVIAAGVASLDHMLSRDGVERTTPGGFRGRVDAKLILETWLGMELDGVTITSVTADGLAGRSKLAAGDKIVAVGDAPVTSARELLAEFRKQASEQDVVALAVERRGDRVEIQVRP